MSDTTYVHEVTRVRGMRVALTMDSDETRALANVAASAIDGALLVDGASEVVLGNAQKIYDWALKVTGILELTDGLRGSDKE